MKRCPACRRDYYDETLLYCLDDGAALLDGPSSGDGSRTVRLKNGSESPTAILSDPSVSEPARRRKWMGIGATAVVLFAAAVGLVVFKPWNKPASSNASQPIKIERLTTNGRATTAAISPDGKF